MSKDQPRLSHFGDYHPKPKRERVSDEELARDRWRNTWPALLIFGGLFFIHLIGFLALYFSEPRFSGIILVPLVLSLWTVNKWVGFGEDD